MTEHEELARLIRSVFAQSDDDRDLISDLTRVILAAGYRKQEPVSDAEVVVASRTISVMWVANPTRPWDEIARAALDAARAVTSGENQ